MYQLAEVDINWIIGLALIFSLSLFMSFMTDKDVETFFIFLTIFSAFAVWSGLLDLWILIVCLILLTVILIMNVKKNSSGF